MTDYRVVETGTRCRLGEGPYWSVRQQALYWVDMLAQTLFRLRPADDTVSTWLMPEMTAWLVERRQADGFVAGMRRDVAFVSLEPMMITPVVCLEPDLPDNRLNDAKVDARGRLWVGTMSQTGQGDAGALYRLDPDGRATCCDRGYRVTNGPAFSPDGRYLYHTDSIRAVVFRFELDDDGTIGNRRVFLRFGSSDGKPDGMTVDAEGAVWIAFWGGARVSRYSADGKLDRSIALPASQITSCAFGGADLDRLYVTSAAEGAETEPAAGALFEIDPQVRGLAPHLFAG